MDKFERVQAAIKGENVDKIPASVWMHYSLIDQDVEKLAETQVAAAEAYDYDFIKLMPYGLYGVKDYGAKIQYFNEVNRPPVVTEYAVENGKDWADLEILSPYKGEYGKTLELAERVGKLTRGSIPFIQTIFSPLTTARKLAGDRILTDIKEHPEEFKAGLQAITDTTIAFVKANIEAGVSGFFFATQCANYDYMTEEQYKEFGIAYDLQVVNAYKDKTFFNVGHLHGANGMFALYSSLPFNVINWHDTWGGPSMAEARKITDKCLLGGVREIGFYDEKGQLLRPSLLTSGTQKEIIEAIKAATVDQVGAKGVMFGPGCVAEQLAVPAGLSAVSKASRNLVQSAQVIYIKDYPAEEKREKTVI